MDPFEVIEKDSYSIFSINETFFSTVPMVRDYLTILVRPISVTVLLILIIISLNNDLKECYKWLILHTAMLELFFICLVELLKYTPKNIIEIYNLKYFEAFIGNLAVNSILLLSFNRFYFFYFKNSHQFLFNSKMIFLIILLYDICIGIILVFISSREDFLEYFIVSLVFIMYLIFPCLIIVRIRKTLKSISKTKAKALTNTLHDLRKAAVVCIFQAFMFSFFLICSFILEFLLSRFPNNYSYGNTKDNFYLIKITCFLKYFHRLIFEIFFIIDSCLILFILKAYRIILIGKCKKLKNYFQRKFSIKPSIEVAKTCNIWNVKTGS